MFRKTLGFVATIIVAMYVMHYVDYHPATLHDIFRKETFAAIVVAGVAIGVLIWAIVRPDSWKVIVAFILGIIAEALGGQFFRENIGRSIVVCVIVIALYCVTVLDRFPSSATARERFNHYRNAARRPSTNP